MPRKKQEVPEFNTEQEEAEFWETHSPFDYNLKLEKVRVKAPKDSPITIRLDSQSREKLEQLAVAYRMGPSTFARRIIDITVQRLSQKPKRSLTIEEALELMETLLPQHLEDKVELLRERNPALYEALENNSEAMEDFIKEGLTFFLRVGGLLKASGITIESPGDQPSEKPRGKMAT